jgi:hypothetical protein
MLPADLSFIEKRTLGGDMLPADLSFIEKRTNVYEGDDIEADVILIWPRVEDSYVSSLLASFKKGQFSSLSSQMALVRVLQLQASLRQPRHSHINGADPFSSDSTLRPLSIPPPPPPPVLSLAQLFSQNFIKSTCSKTNYLHTTEKNDDHSAVEDPNFANMRYHFFKICLQRLLMDSMIHDRSTAVSMKVVFVYQLHETFWGLDTHRLRVIHLAILLDGDLDHILGVRDTDRERERERDRVSEVGERIDFEVDNLIPLISDNVLVVDLLIPALQRRLGRCLLRMEGRAI